MEKDHPMQREQIIAAYHQAGRMVAAGQLKPAEKLLRTALKSDKDDSYCLRLLSVVYKEQGELKKEERVLDHALKTYPEDGYFVGRMAKVYIDTGRYDEADKMTDRKLELNEKPSIERELKLENYHVAYSYKMDITKAQGDNAGFRSWSKKLNGINKEILSLPGKTNLAKKLQSQISEISKASIALSTLDTEQVMNLSNNMLEKNPKDALANWYKVKALLLDGEYKEADREATKRYSMNILHEENSEQKSGKQVSLYLLRAQSSMGMGKIDEAKTWLNDVINIDSNNNAAIGLITATHIDSGDHTTANLLVKQMEQRGDIYALKHRGMLQIKSGEPEQIKLGVENSYKFLSEVPDLLHLKYMRTLASADVIDRAEFNSFVKESADLGRITPKLVDRLTADTTIPKENILSLKTVEAANLSEPKPEEKIIEISKNNAGKNPEKGLN